MQLEQQLRHTQRYLRRLEKAADRSVRKWLRSFTIRDDPNLIDMREFAPIVVDAMKLSLAEGIENPAVGKPLELAGTPWSPYRRAMFKADAVIRNAGLEVVVDDFNTRALAELGRVNRSIQPQINKILLAETTRDIRVALRELINIAEPRVTTVARTAVHAALSTAHQIYDQRNDARIWGYQYITMDDDRVRPEHEAMHFVIQPKEWPGWGYWLPTPNGWNCRCTWLTLYEEYETIEPELIDGGMPMPDPGFVGSSIGV